MVGQLKLYTDSAIYKKIPQTQYLGSKQKLVRWITEYLPPCDSIFDAFSGSGVVSYAFKKLGKRVICNDFLKSSYYYVHAFIENSTVRLSEKEILSLLTPNQKKDDYIEKHFSEVFYTREECKFLDNLYANIQSLENPYKRSLAFAAAIRTCIQKMPGGKFRSDLLRYRKPDFPHFRPKFTADIKDTFLKFLTGYNQAVFDNEKENRAYNSDIFALIPSIKVDMVYFDPPYGGSGFDYERDYFFVELYTAYYGRITEFNGKTRNYSNFKESGFNKKTTVSASLYKLFENSTHIPVWVISYNNRSIPEFNEFYKTIKHFKGSVKFYEKEYSYKHGNNKNLKEYLFVCG